MTSVAASLIATITSLLIQPVASSLVKGIFGKQVSERREGRILLLLAVPLLLKDIFGKGITRVGKGALRAGKGHNNMDHIDKIF